MKFHAIILAAGYGSRLSPLTDQIPKPLLPIAGKPMLIRILEKLKEAGADRIAVNTHHLAEQVERCIRESEFADSVTVYNEPEILGTGGPLVNAKELLADGECFLLHNCDAVTDFDLSALIREHCQSGATATMALIDGPENRVLTEQGMIRSIVGRPHAEAGPEAKNMTYACVAAFSRDIFEYLPQSPCNCSLIDGIVRAIEAGKPVRGFFPGPDALWADIGSFQQYFDIHRRLLGKSVCRGKNCKVDPETKFSGFAAIGDGAEVQRGAEVENCIVLPEAVVPAGYHAWEVITKQGAIHRETRFVSQLPFVKDLPRDWRIRSLREQGSDRKFLRFSRPGKPSRILMISNRNDPDYGRFVTLGKFFNRNGLFTPELYETDAESCTVLMEDLGDQTIHGIAHGHELEHRELYRQIVRTLAEFQIRGTSALDKDSQEIRVFTRPMLLWETSYCRENFFRRLCGLEISEEANRRLDAELLELAGENERSPYLLIHRDFQSQNILLHEGRIRFVDYQGARLAPFAYDLASLLRDPYMSIPPAMRKELAGEYRDALQALDYPLSEEEFRRHYLAASLQRNMQALGAYGFLSLTKGKMRYLDYAAPCLELLIDGLNECPLELPQLRETCAQARERLPGQLELYRRTL